MNRTNLSPATTAAVLAALTEVADRTEKEFHLADQRRADTREHYREHLADRSVMVVLDRLAGESRAAETAMRQARWALAEFRKVAGIDEDRDAAEAQG